MMEQLRIFQVIDATTNSAVSGNQTWYRNLYEPLLELGHDVVLLPAAEAWRALITDSSSAEGRAVFSQKLLDTFRREHARKPFDLFFSYLMDGMVEPAAIDEIRKMGVPTCNFSCNNAHQFYLIKELSPHFDYNLHAERDARSKFIAIGANPLWWQMASNPRYFKPQQLARTVDVSFVGANYALRARYIAHLLDHGIDVHAYGPGWRTLTRSPWRSFAKHYLLTLRMLKALSPQAQYRASAALADYDFRRSLIARYPRQLHAPVSDDELIALYSRSHISLGFLEVFDRHDPSAVVTQHLHLREFEAPMSGALYCTGYSDELAEFYDLDQEVLVYHGLHDLLDKVRYYLAHPSEAERIREAGHARALRDHTYQRRYQQLFDAIGLGARTSRQ